MIKKTIDKIFGPKKKSRFFEPKHYKIGVTTGIPSMDRATVIQQTQMVVSKGTNVIQIDLEYPQSPTAHDIEEIKSVMKTQGLEFTIHAATATTLPVESAEKIDYEMAERDLKDYIKLCKKIGFKAINFHCSYNLSPVLLRDVRRISHETVDENGNSIEEKFKKSDKALEWFTKDFIKSRSLTHGEEFVLRYLAKKEKISGEKLEERFKSLSPGEKENFFIEGLKDYFRDNIPTIDEYTAYVIIAWWMYENGDKIWRNIVGNDSPEKLIGTSKESLLIDAVAGKYLEGHVKKILKDLEEANVMLLIETPDCRTKDYRGYYRLTRPCDLYQVIKVIDHPLVRMTVDFEHIATHGLDVVKEIRDAPKDIGKYIKMLHVGSYPSPAHLHHPVERDDLDLYKLIWYLREKGFLDGYIIYEWGGGRKEEERWADSVYALKWMAMWLEKDVSPDDLPPDFFGITPGEIERELRIIEKNAFRPLEGTLEAPELSHGWLKGEVTAKKKKPNEVWDQEEYR